MRRRWKDVQVKRFLMKGCLQRRQKPTKTLKVCRWWSDTPDREQKQRQGFWWVGEQVDAHSHFEFRVPGEKQVKLQETEEEALTCRNWRSCCGDGRGEWKKTETWADTAVAKEATVYMSEWMEWVTSSFTGCERMACKAESAPEEGKVRGWTRARSMWRRMKEGYWASVKCWRIDLGDREEKIQLIHHSIEENHIIFQRVRECVESCVVPPVELRRSERRQRAKKRIEKKEWMTRGFVVIKRVWFGSTCHG